MSVSVRMMRGRREERYRFLPDTQPREQRDRRWDGRLARTPQQERDWVQRQIDGRQRLWSPSQPQPERLHLAVERVEQRRRRVNRRWAQRNDKTAVRLRRVDADAELGSVQELNPAPLTFGHVDLPTGKRIYVPLEPGQDASSLKNCSLEQINATRRRGGVKAADNAAKASAAARKCAPHPSTLLQLRLTASLRVCRRKAGLAKLKVAVKLGAVGLAKPNALPSRIAPTATGHALGCDCALCARFACVLEAEEEGDGDGDEQESFRDAIEEMVTASVTDAVADAATGAADPPRIAQATSGADEPEAEAASGWGRRVPSPPRSR